MQQNKISILLLYIKMVKKAIADRKGKIAKHVRIHTKEITRRMYKVWKIITFLHLNMNNSWLIFSCWKKKCWGIFFDEIFLRWSMIKFYSLLFNHFNFKRKIYLLDRNKFKKKYLIMTVLKVKYITFICLC